jgi:hypothetical protein
MGSASRGLMSRPSSRWILVLLLVLLVGITGLLLTRSKQSTAGLGATRTSEDELDRNPTDPLSPPTGSETARVEATLPTHPSSNIPVALGAEHDPGTCIVSIIFVDAEGTEHRSKSGGLTLVRWHGESGQATNLDFEGGRFSRAHEKGESWTFQNVFVDRRLVKLDVDPGRPFDPSRRVIEMRARLCPATVVRVVDRDHKTDLGHVELRWDPHGVAPDLLLPPPGSEAMLSGAPSPLEIRIGIDDAWHDAQQFWAGAPGFGWGRFDADLHEGGNHLVELVPGGEVEISITGIDSARASSLRFHPLEPSESRRFQVESRLEGDGIQRFEAVPRGRYRAAIEVGPWWNKPHVLASGEFEVVAGTTVHVSLHVADAPPIVFASLAGTLSIPVEWDVDRPGLTAELLGTSASGRDHFGIDTISRHPPQLEKWQWDAGSVEVGSYELRLHTPPYSAVVEVGVHGRRDVALSVPPPVEVSVHIVDEQTGRPIEADDFGWHPRWPSTITGGSVESAQRDGVTGAVLFRAPEGPVVLSWGGDVLESEEVEVLVTYPRSEHTLRARQQTAIRIEIKDGERTVRSLVGHEIRVEAVGHGGHTKGWRSGPRAYSYPVSSPGRYRVTIPDIPGFESIPSFEVDVLAGHTAGKRIDLVTKR